MSELEERVAKAIFDASGEDDWELQPDAFLEFYRRRARAVLDAIGIEKILDVLRPFATDIDGGLLSTHGSVCRAAVLYKDLGGK